MDGFRDRPLTWLFIAATICVDLVMILPVMFPSRVPFPPQGVDAYVSRRILSVGVPAQLSLVAVWAATSDGFRLVRAAVLTAAVYAALISALLFGLSRPEVVVYFFAPTLVVWSVTLVLWLLGLLPGWSSGNTIDHGVSLPVMGQPGDATDVQGGEDASRPTLPWQFSLVELFGWTCVVALWALAMHHVDLEPYQWSWLARAVVVPLLMVILLGGPGSWPVRGGCVLVVFLLVLRGRGSVGPAGLIPALYLMLWYVVRRLDGALGASSAREA